MKRSHPQPGLQGLEHLAWIMDRALRVPGTNIRVGLDSILGLLPVGGDVLTGVVQVGLVLVALVRYRVPKAVAARMAANVLIDVAIGAIPFLGDLFDIGFKANTRNVKLLQDAEEERLKTGSISSKSSILFLVGIAAILVTAIALVLIGFVTIVVWLFKQV